MHHQITVEHNIKIPVKPNARVHWHRQVQQTLATMTPGDSFTVSSRYLSTEASLAGRLIGKRLTSMRLDDQKTHRLWYTGPCVPRKRPAPAAKSVQVESISAASLKPVVAVQDHAEAGQEEWRNDTKESLRASYDRGEVSDSSYQKRMLRLRLITTGNNSPRLAEIENSELS